MGQVPRLDVEGRRTIVIAAWLLLPFGDWILGWGMAIETTGRPSPRVEPFVDIHAYLQAHCLFNSGLVKARKGRVPDDSLKA